MYEDAQLLSNQQHHPLELPSCIAFPVEHPSLRLMYFGNHDLIQYNVNIKDLGCVNPESTIIDSGTWKTGDMTTLK